MRPQLVTTVYMFVVILLLSAGICAFAVRTKEQYAALPCPTVTTDRGNTLLQCDDGTGYTFDRRSKFRDTVTLDKPIAFTGDVTPGANRGAFIEKDYHKERGVPGTDDRYGVGLTHGGQTRVYAARAHGPATTSLSYAEKEGRWKDVVTVSQNHWAGWNDERWKQNGGHDLTTLDSRLKVNGSHTLMPASHTIQTERLPGDGDSRLHINASPLYLLGGHVQVSNAWGGRGDLGVDGKVHVAEGVQVYAHDPGPMLEKSYGSPADRYGVGQFAGGEMKMYAADPHGKVSLSFANHDIKGPPFRDVLKVTQKGTPYQTDTVTVNGVLLSDETAFTKAHNANDGKEYPGYYGGVKAGAALHLNSQNNDVFLLAPKGAVKVSNAWGGEGNLGVDGTVWVNKGVKVWADNPGPLIEKSYGSELDNRYGVGQWADGTVRTYAAGSYNKASTSISFSDKNDPKGFRDVVKVTQKELGVRGNDTATVNGVLKLGNKFTLSGVGDVHHDDNWLRLFDANGNGYAKGGRDGGGFAAESFWAADRVCIQDVCLNRNDLAKLKNQ